MASIVVVEVIAHFPTLFRACKGCQGAIYHTGLKSFSEQYESYPEEFRRMVGEVSDLALSIKREFGGVVDVKVYDASSPLGILKTLRYLARKTPCVVVNKRKICEGGIDYEAVREAIIGILRGNI